MEISAAASTKAKAETVCSQSMDLKVSSPKQSTFFLSIHFLRILSTCPVSIILDNEKLRM